MRKIKNKNVKMDRKLKQQHLSPTDLLLMLALEEKNTERRIKFFLSLLFDASLIHLKNHRSAWDKEDAYLMPKIKADLTRNIKKFEKLINKMNFKEDAYKVLDAKQYATGLNKLVTNFTVTNLYKEFEGNNFYLLVNLEYMVAWLDLLKLKFINGVGNIASAFDKYREEYNKTVKKLSEYIAWLYKDIDLYFTDHKDKVLSILA